MLKKIYKTFYNYSNTCCLCFFKIYLKKYFKKHIKFRTVNVLEYHGLLEMITKNKQTIDSTLEVLLEHKEYILNTLTEVVVSIRDVSSLDYQAQYYLLDNCQHIKEGLMRQISQSIKTEYDKQKPIGNVLDSRIDELLSIILRDLIDFTIDSVKKFDVANTTAKTKIHEHLVSRMPIFIICITYVLLFKLIDLYISDDMYKGWKILVMLKVYVLSIYLVYMRIYQSIRADTKRLSSDMYKTYKKKLFGTLMVFKNQDYNVYEQKIMKKLI